MVSAVGVLAGADAVDCLVGPAVLIAVVSVADSDDREAYSGDPFRSVVPVSDPAAESVPWT